MTLSLERSGRLAVRSVPWVHLALFAGVLVVYMLTLAPGALGGDAGEYQFVPYILSMAHPTGTPIYILLGKLWSSLPLGPSVAWRMNLLSAVSAGLATVTVFHHVRWSTKRTVPALVAALSLALGLTFWEQATMADKYAFNAFMVALVLHLAMRWGEGRSETGLKLLVFTYGLSLTHHRTMVLFAPTLLAYVWWYERGRLWRDRRRLLQLAVLFLAPLLLYLYLPWAQARDLPPGMWNPETLGDWAMDLYDEEWIREVRVVPLEQHETIPFYLQVLGADFTWAGAVLGAVGLVVVFFRKWTDGALLLSNYLLQALLSANYHVPRHWVFFLPSFVIFALWIGEGLGWAWMLGERFGHRWRRARPVVLGILAVAMLAIPLVSFLRRYETFRELHLGAGVLDPWRQVLKDGEGAERLGRAINDVAPGAIIVCDWEQSTALWYFQQVEGLRPDVTIIYPMERLDEAEASGRPVYLARTHPGLADRWHPASAGPLVELRSEPVRELPPSITPLGVRIGPSLELAGFHRGPADLYPGTVVPLTLYWRALESPGVDYSLSLRLYDESGKEVFKVDSQHPVLGMYPTSRWTAGEVVADYHETQLSSSLPPGTYRWGVIVYRRLDDGGWANMRVDGTDAEVAMGGTFTVRSR